MFMRCPSCDGNVLRLSIAFRGDISCQFADDQNLKVLEKVALNTEFDDEDACRCLTCSWEGLVSDARRVDPEASPISASSSAGLTEAELQEIAADAESLPSRSRRLARRLIGEIQRLNALLETMTRVSDNEGTSSRDTWVV